MIFSFFRGCERMVLSLRKSNRCGFALLAAVAAFFFSCTRPYNESYPVRAVDGVLDLREQDFLKDGPVALKGGWEFYWNELYSPSDFNQQQKPVSSIAEVPSSWNEAKKYAGKTSIYGCATYRLNVLLPSRTPPLSLRIPAVDTAYRVIINGKDLCANGRVGRDKASSKPVYYAPVSRELSRAQEIEIIVQMSNFDFPRPGMKDCFVLGEAREILLESENRLALNIFVVGAMILMAMYHFALFCQRPSDRSGLYFALLCISTLSRLLVTGEGYAYHFSFMTWEIGSKVEYLSLLGWAIGIMFMRTFFPKEVSLKILTPVFLIIAILSATVLFTPVMVFTRLLLIFDIVSIFFILYFFYALILAMVRKREYSTTIAVGVVLFMSTIANDMLLGYRLIDSVYVMPYGLFAFFFLQSTLLSRKFAKVFSTVSVLSQRLEDKVFERTQELDIERQKLAFNNTTMENELLLAQKIQQQMLPLYSPFDDIFTVYHPMMPVGGDFFDFIRFRDKNKIGIFLSDVSGHGVSAAFITLMLKSILLQAGVKKENPSEMLHCINEVLFDQTGGYFCTAFYGIYNRGDRTFTYANAGHDQPFIIENSSIRALSGKRGAPVGVMDNHDLEIFGKGYLSSTEVLPENSKLFLYTDGLTETRPINGDNIFFSDSQLNETLIRLSNNGCHEFAENVFEQLVLFRGSRLFEDDIALICLDIPKK